MKDLFLLNPDITYLNFGSFGACPKPIFETYQQWQLQLEREPVHFIVHQAIEELELSYSLTISTGWLNTLQCVHRPPINLVVY